MAPRVTIDRLARHLGLSKFSVSRALSGKNGVGDATRARVLRAAANLGYRPAGTSAPVQRRILLIMQDQDPVSSELWINILHGAEREAELHGLSVIPRLAARDAVMPITEPSVVGLILAVNAPDTFMPWAVETGLPVACGGYGRPLAPADHALGSDWEGAFSVAQHLQQLGHRRIGFVRGMSGLVGREERWRGLGDGAAAAGGGMELYDIGFAEPHGFRDAFLRMVGSGFAPSALFCAHDGLAITVISVLMGFGIHVPDDISVVGFNDFVCATQIVPQLTTVRMPQEALGAALVRCIAMRLAPGEGIEMPPLRILLTPEVVIRNSTAHATAPKWIKRLGDPSHQLSKQTLQSAAPA